LYLEEKWDGINWVNVEKQSYTYDFSGKLKSGRSEEWDEEAWIADDFSFKFNDSFGRDYDYYASEIHVYYSTITDVEEPDLSVLDYYLAQNYPNPFNPSTVISYTIPPSVKGETANVKLIVYDVLGREVATPVNKEQSAGSYEVKFDASKLTSGIYFYKLQSGGFVESRKMVLVK